MNRDDLKSKMDAINANIHSLEKEWMRLHDEITSLDSVNGTCEEKEWGRTVAQCAENPAIVCHRKAYALMSAEEQDALARRIKEYKPPIVRPEPTGRASKACIRDAEVSIFRTRIYIHKVTEIARANGVPRDVLDEFLVEIVNWKTYWEKQLERLADE